jgi:hypothetical protein
VIAALQAPDDASQPTLSYDELWELRLLGLERAARSR